MNIISGVTTWEDLTNYIDNTLGIKYTENPTGWAEAMREVTKGYKYVNVTNEATGQTTGVFMNEQLVSGVGEVHTVPGNGEAWASGSGTTAAGGAKSMPTAKSIITNNSSQTALIEEEATGVKDVGILNVPPAMNIISGIMQAYGLIHAGINIANAQVWKDMSNYVYGTEFTSDTPLERVIDFFKMKATNCIADHKAALSDDPIAYVPDTIAQRMYDFLCNHMVETVVPGDLNPEVHFNYFYNFIHRAIELANPATYTLQRYQSVFSGEDDYYVVKLVEISDDLFKKCVEDFISQLLGSGFLVASSVATALIASMEGVMQYLKTQSVDAVDNAQFCQVHCGVWRGSTPPPKTTPLALSDMQVRIICQEDDHIQIHTFMQETPTVDFNLAITPNNKWPGLASGYSYRSGDLTQYLKRGRTGEDDNDYAYNISLKRQSSGSVARAWQLDISYPANEQHFNYGYYSNWSTQQLMVNGYSSPNMFAWADADVKNTIPDNGLAWGYSNLGYKGTGISYMPDDYLLRAGIRSKVDSSGAYEIHPNPNKTKEEVYPALADVKQAANSSRSEQGGVVTTNNNIVNYIPTAIPNGSDVANRLINHGLNNTDDPQSYIDDRPQSNKLKGYINTDDPISGFNEDVNNAVDDYNDSKYSPDSYPNPVPANQPNPQYPTNPPTNTSGDTGDTPTPSTMAGVTASGMCSVYNPTKQELMNFSAWLWSPNFLDNFLKIFQNPMDAIIGLHIMYATPSTTTPSNIICGYLDSGVSANVVNQQFTEIDCGTVDVPEYYGNAIDYEPYTQVHCYLPFIGIVSLKPNDVIGKKLNIKYGVDALTGTCLAILTTKKGTSDIACYNFAGNCATQIPISGGSYAQMITGLAGFVASGVGAAVSGNPLMALGAGASLLNSHLDVGHSGAIGANAGAMGIRKPYLIITRKSAYEAAEYGTFYGYPANKTVTLGSCKGYTRIKSVHVEIPRATANEKSEIEHLLKQGVIIN